ncbi:MAG: trypsin-like peptidase domain-containing protein [Candidatus Sumerlaeaceae bacterium]
MIPNKTGLHVLAASLLIALPAVPALAETAPDQPITRYTFRDVARKVAPAVVNIRIKSNIVFGKNGGPRNIQIPPNFGFDDQMREYLEKLFEREMPNMSPRDADEYKYARSGSGVIIRPEGYVITSNHVVASTNANDIEVSLPDGRSFNKVKIVGTDDLTDLAVLKIDEEVKDLPHIAWGDSDKLEVGDFVVAIGNPLEFNNSVSEGIVSAKHRTIKKAPIEDLIQTTAMINPGNSGGALVDLDGSLIGINMAIATSTGMWSGLGFAIPSHTAKDVTDQIIDRGKVARGYLGIDMATLTTNLGEQLGYDQQDGIVVKGVRPGSAAERAGLQRYDIIARVGGKEIKEINDMHRNIGGRRSGEQVELEIFRDEGTDKLQQKKIVVTLDERPSVSEIDKMLQGPNATDNAPKLPGNKADKGLLGLQVEPRPEGKGVVVKEVEERSRAGLAGIQKGDAILEVNRQPVNNTQDLQKAMRDTTNNSHLFFVERQGTSAFVTIPAE